jgi:hypothetical protein
VKRLGWQLGVTMAVSGGLAWWVGCDRGESKAGAVNVGGGGEVNLGELAAGTGVAQLPARPASLPRPGPPYYGISWQVHQSQGIVEEARLMLGQIAELGADTVLISNPGYQENAASRSFRVDPAVTPSKEQWRQIFKIAHDDGLRVVLMPIILLSNPRGTEWRGVINPSSWDDWFEQYTKFVVYFARIAAENNVEVLSVGSELVSTERYTDRWRNVIREVRKVYPGKLTYSANWDHYKVVEFWDELDLVGMTSYYKLSDDPDPTMETLLGEWAPIKRGILRWQSKIGKPLLFTEVGWCSQEGTSIEPWNYYYKQEATAGGLEEQRRCYQAFMETWKNTPEVGGIIWWEWMNTPGGPEDFNYTPKGKPAERELRGWFKEMHAGEGRAAAAERGRGAIER